MYEPRKLEVEALRAAMARGELNFLEKKSRGCARARVCGPCEMREYRTKTMDWPFTVLRRAYAIVADTDAIS